MTPADLAVLGLTIVVSSFVSGTFGMAGGMVLLGVLLVYFDVTTAMVLFSIIQFFANGWRVVLWWRYIKWPIFWWYMSGALIAAAGLRAVAYVPDKALVYFLLGIMPFAVDLLPVRARPDIEWRGVPLLTGILTTVIQILAGVGGLFLDIFFQKSKLDRKTIIATKAPTQTFSHILRGAYFGSFGGFQGFNDAASLGLIAGAVVLAMAGVSLAPYVIERMTDDGFRRWMRAIIVAISVVYLVRAVQLTVISTQWPGILSSDR
jgi:uncharacterized membrane protein YfcA